MKVMKKHVIVSSSWLYRFPSCQAVCIQKTITQVRRPLTPINWGLFKKPLRPIRRTQVGFLPIKTRDADTDIYIKYPIEFEKIVPAYTEKIPGNAYETGGIYQYVLMDVEAESDRKVGRFDDRPSEYAN